MSNEEPPRIVAFSQIASEIEAMAQADQQMRERNLAEDEYWDDELDKRNTERMKTIVAEIGWPTVSKVGEDGMQRAWLLVQHADHDPDFQEECLWLMKEQPEGEIDKRRIAFLEDRIRVNRKQPQLYGTQFTQRENNHIPQPIEDKERVNERRTEMGLDTLEDNIRQMYETYPFEANK